MSRRYGNILFVFAGLPSSVQKTIENIFEKKSGYPQHECIFINAPDIDSDIYRSNSVKSGFGNVAKRIIEGRSGEKIDPRAIVLFYVPYGPWESAISEFDFFVYPVALTELSHFDQNGQMFRHFPSVVGDVVRRKIDYILDTDPMLTYFLQEIGRRYRKCGLLLPRYNFVIDRNGTRISERLKEIRSGRCTIEDFYRYLRAAKITSSELPEFLKKNERSFAYIDERDLLFPVARRREFHGLVRRDSKYKEIEKNSVRHILNGLYRFGIAFDDGLHYDVQRNGNTPVKEYFECCVNGQKWIDAIYVNVHPNDYVR